MGYESTYVQYISQSPFQNALGFMDINADYSLYVYFNDDIFLKFKEINERNQSIIFYNTNGNTSELIIDEIEHAETVDILIINGENENIWNMSGEITLDMVNDINNMIV